uniref:Peptide chain release factor domain-containing protein n=3 Tax=Zea mays TaxID=4577 RepID=A0A804RGC4_MAIZE
MSQQLPANLVEIMEQRMKLIEQRSAYLQEQINQPAASPEEYLRANKEFRKLESTMELIKDLRSKQEEIEGLKSLVANDREEKDMREMAAEELLVAVEEEKRLQHELFRSLLPKDEANEKDCILEVRAGTGGEEASLFAMDIFRMYEKYAQKNGWKFDVIDIMESAVEGYKVQPLLVFPSFCLDIYTRFFAVAKGIFTILRASLETPFSQGISIFPRGNELISLGNSVKGGRRQA